MVFLRKYGTGTGADVYVPIVKRGVVDFAVNADWTPASGDVKLSIDGGAAANIGTLPTAIAMGNTAYWKFVFADAELQGKVIVVTVADSATKAVEDQAFVVETYGNASAKFIADLSLANLPANVTQLLGTAWLTPSTAGTPDVNVKLIGGTSQTGADVGGIVSSGTHGNAALKTLIDTVDTVVDSILVDTAEIGAAGAGLTALASAANLAAVAGYLDTEIAAILADTNELQTDWANGGRLDVILDGIAADNPNTPTKNVALADLVFTMVDATDFNTPETGVTVTATISKDGGSFASCTNAVSEISGGFYKISLTQTEMNADSIALKFTGSGCAQRNFAFRTQPT